MEIWVGNLNDMVFGEQFDYIVLNGVFEYAPGFTEGDQPCETFLKNIKRLLKPEGILLIAIENRFGLKYFAGAPEDHTNGYFDGIAGYPDNHSVRTFSKGEWERLMEACGFSYHRFYYPYPDYKFPREVFTDESLKEQKYESSDLEFHKIPHGTVQGGTGSGDDSAGWQNGLFCQFFSDRDEQKSDPC